VSDTSPFEPSLVGAIWRDRVLVACVLISCLGLAVAYAVTRPVEYTATASVLVEDPRDQTGDPPERFVADQAAVIRSSNVAREANRVDLQRRPPLGLSTTYYLKHTSVGLSARDSNLIRVSMTAATPTAAKLGVDNVVQAYKNVLQTNATNKYRSKLAQIDAELLRIDGSLANVSRQLAATPAPTGVVLDGLEVQQRQLLERQNNLRVDRESVVGQVDQVTRTVALYDPPEKATKAGLLASARTFVLAIMVGFILAGTAAYIRATRKPTFFRANEPELMLGAPLLADVPGFDARRGRALPVIEAPTSAAARAYRYAAASVDLQRASAGVRCLAVTSAGEGDGRSTATANIALALAGSGVHTLVIDGDLETQGLSGLLRGNQGVRPGWLDLVAGRAGLTDVIVRVPTGNDEGLALDLLSAGERRTSAAEFFGAENSRRLVEVLLAELADRYDVVLIDAPPMLQVTHAATLAGCADSVLVVVSHGGSLADQEEIGRRLRLIGRAPLGYLYNHPASRRSARRTPAPAPAPAVALPPEPAIAVVPSAAPTAKVPNLRPASAPTAESWTCACNRSNPPAFANCPRCGRPQPGAPRHRSAGG
jgi:Mrp family chromosome partitioning ATPase